MAGITDFDGMHEDNDKTLGRIEAGGDLIEESLREQLAELNRKHAALRRNVRKQLLMIQKVADDPEMVRTVVCDLRAEIDNEEFTINVEDAFDRRDLNGMQQWVANGGDLDRMDRKGRTFLVRAVKAGWNALLFFCMERHCNINLTDMYGWNALHYAAEANLRGVAEALIAFHINVDLESTADLEFHSLMHPRGTTALQVATRRGHVEMAELLRKNRSYTVQELMDAVSKGDVQVVSRYIECGGDLEARDGDGRTPMISAATSCHRRIMNLLIKANCDVNARDTVYNGTALIGLVCFSKREEERRTIADDLIRAGININAVNKFGWSALHYAVEHNLESIVERLTDEPTCIKDLESTTKLTRKTIPHPPGTKPVHVASRRGHDHLLRYLPDCYSFRKVTQEEALAAAELGDVNVLQHYVRTGGILEFLDKMGRSILIRACAYGRDKVVKFCISQGGNSRARDTEYNGTAMISCTCNDNLEKPRLRICKLLVEAGVEVNGVNKYGWSALHYAVEHDLQSVVEFLVFEANHDLDIASRQQMTRKRIPHRVGTTATDIGIRRKNTECVNIIKAKRYIDRLFADSIDPLLDEILGVKRKYPPLITKLISEFLRSMLRAKDVVEYLDQEEPLIARNNYPFGVN